MNKSIAVDYNKDNDKLKEKLYETYKQEWIKDHISEDRLKQSYNDYSDYVENECKADFNNTPANVREYETFEEFSANYEADMTYTEYIEEYGFDGEIYACYEEFLDNECKDPDWLAEHTTPEEYFMKANLEKENSKDTVERE